MKGTTLIALFLLSALTSNLASAAEGDLVLDYDGEILDNGGRYFVLPVMRGMGGGIEAVATGNESCPLTVAQSDYEASRGFATIISSMWRSGFIAEGDLLTFEFVPFPVIPPCAPTPTEWSVVNGLPEGAAVKLKAYKDTIDGWFKIEKASLPEYPFYKLLFCPLPVDDVTCGNVGVSFDNRGIRRLVAFEEKPLLIAFKKVPESGQDLKNPVRSRSESV